MKKEDRLMLVAILTVDLITLAVLLFFVVLK